MSWPLGSLKDIAEVISGYAFKSTWFDEGVDKVIRIGDLQEGKVNLQKSKTFDSSVHTVREQFRVRSGDILMALSGATVGKIAVADGKCAGAYLNQRVAIIRAKQPESASYIKYIFSGNYLDTLLLNAGGAAQPNLSPKDLLNMQIPLPPLDEQKRIAAILDKADAIRQKRKQAIELADEFLRSVFLDMFGDPVTNPKGWEIKAIGELATKVTDGEHQTPKREEKGYKLLSARNVQHGFLDVENEKVDYVGEAEFQRITKRLSISKSDVLLSCSGTIGRVSMNTLNEPFCLVRSVAVIRLADNGVIPEFLVGYLGTSALQAIMKKEANSSGQPNLFQNQIKQLKVLVPPLELQAKYKRFLDHYKEKKASLISGNEQQALLFKSLSQKAFSGQL
ncbi:restriction endonuclease subunit S [Vibrio campbellii]